MTAEQIELWLAVPICAWCKGSIKPTSSEPDEVSHGICPRHLKKLKAEILGTPLKGARRPRDRERTGEPQLPLRY